MPCGLNSDDINTDDINDCSGDSLITLKSWVDEKIPRVLAYNPNSRGEIICLPSDNTHDELPNDIVEPNPTGGKKEC